MTSTLLHDNLRATAERTPTRPASRCGAAEVDYQTLDVISNQIARMLHQCGAKKGDRVGILLDRSLEVAFAVYGTLKAGVVYVPIDPLSPAARIQHIVENCGITHLITAPNKARFIKDSIQSLDHVRYVLGCDTPEWETSREPHLPHFISWPEIRDLAQSSFHAPAMRSDDLAYIMFTSGSTGLPKGMMHTHGSGHAYARIAAETYSISADDRVGNHSPLHFDISLLGYFAAPLAGATTIIIPEAHARMPASMSQLAADEQLTIWYSVPFALIQLLTRGALEERDLSSLRWVLFAGEPFSPRQIRELMDRWPQAQFANVYGPAEVNQCTLYVVPKTLIGTEASIPIGDVWADTDRLILRANDTPATSGEIGELLIHSPTMMEGYWNQPELNSKCFFKDPIDQKLFFRTGDRVSMDNTSVLHYHGRADRLVKIRGNRIELDEVEATILKHPRVEEAAVYILESGTENERLELALSVENAQAQDEDVFRSYLEERLPRFAVPDRIIFPSSFPRTASGKIDRMKMARMYQ